MTDAASASAAPVPRADLRTIDLHAHTTASDGTLTPAELMRLASEIGLTAVAVTDHDTLGGLSEASDAAGSAGVELVPGVEISVDYKPGKMDMLGLLIEADAPAISQRLTDLQANRASRNDRMLAKLTGLGIDLTLEDVRAESSGHSLGRPHMARALVRKRVVDSVQEAFDLYLGAGGAAYIPKDKIGPAEAIRLIHDAGGLAFIAHPSTMKLEDDALGPELRRLRELGLDGVECYYSQYDAARIQSLLRLARSAGLLPSGGSDFHGGTKLHVSLGKVDGDLPAPTALLDAMKERLASRRSAAYASGRLGRSCECPSPAVP